jgi:hypothetical protein
MRTLSTVQFVSACSTVEGAGDSCAGDCEVASIQERRLLPAEQTTYPTEQELV